MLIGIDKITALNVALTIGHALKEIATLDSASTYDVLTSSVLDFNMDDEVNMDSIDSEVSLEMDTIQNETDTMIIAYLDSIGVPEEVISDLVSHNDNYSMDSLSHIASSFAEKFDDEATADSALDFAMNYAKEGYTFDGIVKPKKGYKRQLVVRKGKKTWVNKRVSGRVRLSPKQKMALIKARLKSHTGLAKLHRAKSARVRKSAGM